MPVCVFMFIDLGIFTVYIFHTALIEGISFLIHFERRFVINHMTTTALFCSTKSITKVIFLFNTKSDGATKNGKVANVLYVVIFSHLLRPYTVHGTRLLNN